MCMDFIYPEPGCGEVDDRPLIVARIHYMYFALLLCVLAGITVVIISYAGKRPDPSKTVRTTFWTRHDPSVPACTDETTKPAGDEVTEAVVTSPHYGRHLEMTILVSAATVAPSAGGSATDRDVEIRHHSGNCISPSECTVAVISPDKTPDAAPDPAVELRRSTWWNYFRRCLDWFCGLDSSTVSTPTRTRRLRDMTSLHQTRGARAALYTALTVLISLDLFLYVFFSAGSDFGLLRNYVPPSDSLFGNHTTRSYSAVLLNHTLGM